VAQGNGTRSAVPGRGIRYLYANYLAMLNPLCKLGRRDCKLAGVSSRRGGVAGAG